MKILSSNSQLVIFLVVSCLVLKIYLSPIPGSADELQLKQPKGILNKQENFPKSFYDYASILKKEIHQYWSKNNKRPDLRAIISASVSKNGNLNNIKIKTSSGDKDFDQLCVKSIEVAKVPPPPIEVYHYFKSVSFTFQVDR